MATISEKMLVRNGDDVVPTTDRAARAAVLGPARALIAFGDGASEGGATFEAFEKTLLGQEFALARAHTRCPADHDVRR